MSVDKQKHVREIYDRAITIPLGSLIFEGRLTVPQAAANIVIFAHGSGSSRFSPRNWFVAEFFHDQNIATLVIDLLTAEEAESERQTGHLRFNIPMLARRLAEIARWTIEYAETKHLHVCFFGSSTGAAAALIAAAESTDNIVSIVSRGGRPDLAGDYLPCVKAPTLLIVGGDDTQVLALNEQALAKLNKCSGLEVISGATHLFEEKGALEKVAHLAADWFKHHVRQDHAIP